MNVMPPGQQLLQTKSKSKPDLFKQEHRMLHFDLALTVNLKPLTEMLRWMRLHHLLSYRQGLKTVTLTLRQHVVLTLTLMLCKCTTWDPWTSIALTVEHFTGLTRG